MVSKPKKLAADLFVFRCLAFFKDSTIEILAVILSAFNEIIPMRPIVFLSLLLFVFSIFAEEIDKKFPLDPQLKVLSEDVKNERYREMVTKKMLSTDLAAEWQRGFTADNPESFLEKNGGREKLRGQL